MVKYITPSTRNITRLFREATTEQIVAGRDWYLDANAVAQSLGRAHNLETGYVSGIIAALSPLNSWGANVNLTARLLQEDGLDSGYLSAGLAKANAILEYGKDHQRMPNQEDIAFIERTLKGLKTINFFRSILTSGQSGICIDRHAYSLAVNTRHDGEIPTLSTKRYNELANCYDRASRILSREYETMLTPAQVQSVTWTLWRNKFWSVGAFDSHTVEV